MLQRQQLNPSYNTTSLLQYYRIQIVYSYAVRLLYTSAVNVDVILAILVSSPPILQGINSVPLHCLSPVVIQDIFSGGTLFVPYSNYREQTVQGYTEWPLQYRGNIFYQCKIVRTQCGLIVDRSQLHVHVQCHVASSLS